MPTKARLSVWERITLRWASIRYPLGALVSWLATVIGIVAGLGSLLASMASTETWREFIWGWTLVAIAGIAFTFFALSHFKRAKGRALANTIGQQSHASRILRDTRSFLRIHARAARQGETGRTWEGARSQIEAALTAYANVYSATTGARCRMCVKLIRVRNSTGPLPPMPSDLFLYALARDSTPATENRVHDQKRSEEYLDALVDNYDFLKLWSPDEADDGVFISDDLRKEADYVSSSMNYRQNVEGNPNKSRGSDWPLWYISTIVWPIRQERNETLGIESDDHQGFLSVDSRMRGACDREVHVPIGTALANALYPVIDLYTEILAYGDNQREADDGGGQ